MQFTIFNLQFSIVGVTRVGEPQGRCPELVSRRKDLGWQDPENGQSLFELVVAVAISALVLVAIVSLASNSLRNASFSKNSALASSFAQSTTEWLRTQRDGDIVNFLAHVSLNSPLPTTYCFTDLNWNYPTSCTGGQVIAGTPFTRSGVFTVSYPGGKTSVEAQITVSWTDAGGIHEITSSTTYTDWRQR